MAAKTKKSNSSFNSDYLKRRQDEKNKSIIKIPAPVKNETKITTASTSKPSQSANAASASKQTKTQTSGYLSYSAAARTGTGASSPSYLSELMSQTGINPRKQSNSLLDFGGGQGRAMRTSTTAINKGQAASQFGAELRDNLNRKIRDDNRYALDTERAAGFIASDIKQMHENAIKEIDNNTSLSLLEKERRKKNAENLTIESGYNAMMKSYINIMNDKNTSQDEKIKAYEDYKQAEINLKRFQVKGLDNDISSYKNQLRLEEYKEGLQNLKGNPYKNKPSLEGLPVYAENINERLSGQKYGKGNINLYDRPILHNDDGSISTVDSISVNDGVFEVLIPTVIRDENGSAKKLTKEQAIARYRNTGEYLGKFDTAEQANKYARDLEIQQKRYYSDKPQNVKTGIDFIDRAIDLESEKDPYKRYQKASALVNYYNSVMPSIAEMYEKMENDPEYLQEISERYFTDKAFQREYDEKYKIYKALAESTDDINRNYNIAAKEYIKELEKLPEFQAYKMIEEAKQNKDFAEVVGKARTVVDEGNQLKRNWEIQKLLSSLDYYGGRDTHYYHMTKEEQDTLLYLYNTDKKQAKEYYNLLRPTLNDRINKRGEEFLEKVVQLPVVGPVTKAVADVAIPTMEAITAPINIASEVLYGRPAADFSGGKAALHRGFVKSLGGSKFAEGFTNFGEGFGQMVGLMSGSYALGGAESAGRLLNSVYFMSGLEDGISSARERNADLFDGIMLGIANGTAEVLFNKLGTDKLLSMIGKPTTSIVKAMINSGISEFTEEALTQIAQTISDGVIMGENSEYALYKKQLIEQGMSEQEAEKKAFKEFYITRPLEAGKMGGLTGMFMGGANSFFSTYDAGKTASENLSEYISAATSATNADYTSKGGRAEALQADIARQYKKGENAKSTFGQNLARGRAVAGMEQLRETPKLMVTQSAADSAELTSDKRQFLANAAAKGSTDIIIANLNDPSKRYRAGDRYINGMWYSDGNKLFIDPRAARGDIEKAITVHELTHAAESSGYYKQYANYVKDRLGKDEFYDRVTETAKEQRLTPLGAEKEVIAYFTQNELFQNADEMERFINHNYTLANQVVDSLKDGYDKVKAMLGMEAADNGLRYLERAVATRVREGNKPYTGDYNNAFIGALVQYSSSIKEEITERITELNSTEPIVKLNNVIVSDSGRAQNLNWIMEQFKDSGYEVNRENFGTIIFDKKRISNSLRYLKTDGELAAYAALPDVLENGLVIGKSENHKGRRYSTVTIAAPIEINGQRLNMAAVVRKDGDSNYYKVHRVLMPDGTMFDYEKNNAERAGRLLKNEAATSPADVVFKNRIPQNNSGVKSQNSVEQLNSEQAGKINSENGLTNGASERYNVNERRESYGERSEDFRRIQTETQGMDDEIRQLFRSGSREITVEIRGRLARIFRGELETERGGSGNANGLLTLTDSKTENQFRIYEAVDGSLFHDIFNISRNYLKNGELVDVHGIETTEDGIGYNDCYNYISDDGLSGFSITPNGDLISVFNLSDKRGFLRAISSLVKENAKTLDCYVSDKQNLQKMYSKTFGFKTASLMDYNMEFDHDSIAENHGSPQVAFMVNTPENVETKHFTKDQYDEAVAYQQSFVNETETERGARFFDAQKSADTLTEDEAQEINKTSRLHESLTEKGVSTDESKAALEDNEEGFKYKPITNRETYNRARAYVEEGGLENVMSGLSAKAGEGKLWNADEMAQAGYIYTQLQKAGRTNDEVNFATVFSRQATKAGQAVQAMAILNRLTPEGKLLYITKTADNATQASIRKKIAGKNEKQFYEEFAEAEEADAKEKAKDDELNRKYREELKNSGELADLMTLSDKEADYELKERKRQIEKYNREKKDLDERVRAKQEELARARGALKSFEEDKERIRQTERKIEEYEGKLNEVEKSRNAGIKKAAEEVHTKAVDVQKKLEGIMRAVNDKFALDGFEGNAKSVQSLYDKVVRKADNEGSYDDYDVLTPKDHVRGVLKLQSYEQAASVIRELKKEFGDIEIEIKDEPKSGYFGIHITSKLDGLNAEIQLHTAEGWRIKLESDEVYHKWRNKDLSKISDEERVEYKSDMQTSKQMFDDYFAELGLDKSEIKNSVEGLAERQSSPNVKLTPSETHEPFSNERGGSPSFNGELSTSKPDSSTQRSSILTSRPAITKLELDKSEVKNSVEGLAERQSSPPKTERTAHEPSSNVRGGLPSFNGELSTSRPDSSTQRSSTLTSRPAITNLSDIENTSFNNNNISQSGGKVNESLAKMKERLQELRKQQVQDEQRKNQIHKTEARIDSLEIELKNLEKRAEKLKENRDKISVLCDTLRRLRGKGDTKTNVEKLYDKYNIDYMPGEQKKYAAEIIEVIDSLDHKEDLVNIIMRQSRMRGTKEGERLRRQLMKTDITFLKSRAWQQVIRMAQDAESTPFMKKLATFRIQAMLSGLATWNRNVGSNLGFGLIDGAANNVAVIFDALASIKTGKRTVAFDKTFGMGGMKEGFKAFRESNIDIKLDTQQGGSKYGLGRKQVFKSKPMSAWERGLGYALQSTDAFSEAMSKSTTEKGLKKLREKGYIQLSDEEIETFANETALYRTFKDENRAVKGLIRMKNGLNEMGFALGDLVAPFVQVPGNIIMRGLEFSPMGYLKLLSVIGESRRSGVDGASQRKMALTLGRAITGTGLTAAAGILASLGIITALDDDKDEDKRTNALQNMQGRKGMALNLGALNRVIYAATHGGDLKEAAGIQDGDEQVSFDWFQPISTVMAIGAAVNESYENEQNGIGDLSAVMFKKTWDEILEAPVFEGIQTLFNSNYGDLGERFVTLGVDGLTSFLPRQVSQTAQFLDDKQRSTYTESNIWDKSLNRVKYSVPVLRNTLPEKVDQFGRSVSNTSGNRVLDFLNDFINPGRITKYNEDPIAQKLLALNDSSVIPNNISSRKDLKIAGKEVSLYGKDLEQYKKAYGQEIYTAYKDLMNSDIYKNASEKKQIKMLTKIKDGATAVAQFKYAKSADLFDSKKEEIMADVDAYKVFWRAKAAAQPNKNENIYKKYQYVNTAKLFDYLGEYASIDDAVAEGVYERLHTVMNDDNYKNLYNIIIDNCKEAKSYSPLEIDWKSILQYNTDDIGYKIPIDGENIVALVKYTVINVANFYNELYRNGYYTEKGKLGDLKDDSGKVYAKATWGNMTPKQRNARLAKYRTRVYKYFRKELLKRYNPIELSTTADVDDLDIFDEEE